MPRLVGMLCKIGVSGLVKADSWVVVRSCMKYVSDNGIMLYDLKSFKF